MLYLLLMLTPVAMSAGCFVLRRQTRLVALVGADVALVELLLLLRVPVDEPVRLLGTTVLLSQLGQMALAGLLLLIGSMFCVWAAFPSGESAVPATLVALALGVMAVLVQLPFAAALLWMMAQLVLLLLVFDQPGESSDLIAPAAIAAALKYLLVTAIGGLLLLVGLGLSQVAGGVSPAGYGLLLAGFSLWIGLVPFHVALGDLAEVSSTPVFAIVLGSAQVVALFLLVGTVQAQPRMLLDSRGAQALLLGLAGLTALGAPLIAGGSTRRIVALLLAGHMGQIVAGLALLNAAGARSALLGMLAHAIAATLICAGLYVLEVRVPGRREDQPPGLARPIAAAALVAGILVVVGVPPFGGWLASALLFQAAFSHGPVMLVVVAAGHLALVVAAMRLLRLTLFAPRETSGFARPVDPLAEELSMLPAVVPPYAPLALRAWLLALILLALLAGIYPAPVLQRVDRVVESLTFVQTTLSTDSGNGLNGLEYASP